MRPTDQLLVVIISGESTVIIALLGWSLRNAAKQVALQAEAVKRIGESLERHLAWHDGLEDRNAWRTGPPGPLDHR